MEGNTKLPTKLSLCFLRMLKEIFKIVAIQVRMILALVECGTFIDPAVNTLQNFACRGRFVDRRVLPQKGF